MSSGTTKSDQGKNMEIGAIRSSRNGNLVVGSNLPDPFFDSYEEETLTLYDILNLAGSQSQTQVTITFNRAFLKKLVHSHLTYIKQLEKEA